MDKSTNETAQIFIDAWKTLVPRLPTGAVHHADGVVAALGNVELPFLNVCFHDGPLADLESVRSRLRTSKDLTEECKHPWLFALSQDWAPQGWEGVVRDEGLEVAMVTTGMVAERLSPPTRPLPDLEFRRVADEQTARDIAELNGRAYQMPLSMMECICNLALWREDSYGYVGYLKGVPVTCSATFPVNGTVYVAFVATHPDHGGRGYAEAVMRHSVQQGSAGMGLTRTSLHATEAGRPLYAAMGYRGDAKFHLISKPHVEG